MWPARDGPCHISRREPSRASRRHPLTCPPLRAGGRQGPLVGRAARPRGAAWGGSCAGAPGALGSSSGSTCGQLSCSRPPHACLRAALERYPRWWYRRSRIARAPHTWNRHLSSIHPWVDFAAARGVPWLPADPTAFAEFLATRGRTDAGYPQTKARVCAIYALSPAAGVAPPADHPFVQAMRGAARRTKRARRGPARSRCSPTRFRPPPLTGPRPGSGATGPAAPVSERSQRARCAVAAHVALIHEGAVRHDDT